MKNEIKSKLKKYRSSAVLACFLVFQVLQSIYFSGSFLKLNPKPIGAGELLCDNIVVVGMFFALFMGILDLFEWNSAYQMSVRRLFEKEISPKCNYGKETE